MYEINIKTKDDPKNQSICKADCYSKVIKIIYEMLEQEQGNIISITIKSTK